MSTSTTNNHSLQDSSVGLTYHTNKSEYYQAKNCSFFGRPECHPEILYSIPMVIITLAIILGNVLILLIFRRIYHKTCLPVEYLANLAIADLGVGVCNAFFCLPLVFQGRWPDSHQYSDAIGFIINTFSAVSAMTLGVIGVDRYLFVSRAMTYHRIMTKMIKICIIVVLWIVSAGLGLPGLFGVVHFIYNEHAYLSYIHFTDSIAVTLLYVVGILLPVIITMVVCYAKIYLIARKHIRELRDRGAEQKSTIHVVTTLVLTVLCFVLCWTPYAVLNFTKAVIKSDHDNRLVDFSITWLAAANSCANCVIYWLRQAEVRSEARALLCCRKKTERRRSRTLSYVAMLNGGQNGGPTKRSNNSADNLDVEADTITLNPSPSTSIKNGNHIACIA